MYKIPKQLLEAVVTYLSKQPYVETWQLIQLLQQAEEIKEEVEEKKSKGKS